MLSGVCLDQSTVEFSKYLLKSQVGADVRSGYISNGKDPKYLSKLPVFVGGHTDFMIGVKYLQYPVSVTAWSCIYKSWFKNADGTSCVIGGPHTGVTEIESSNQVNARSFLTDQYKLLKSGYQMNPDASMLHVKFKKDHLNDAVVNTYQFSNADKARQKLFVRKQKMFKDFENIGSEISYRCSKCRNCKVCKEHSTDEI